MAEKITPMPVVGGGTVDVSKPNDSGIHALAGALDVGVRSAATIAHQAQVNEFQNIQSLLKDATVGPDEAKEIAGNAFFPVNRFAAQNRAGEAKVTAARDAIEADLVNAKDSIEARQMLRGHQQKLMEDEPDLGVQAGIRQAIADIAPTLINDASKKRLDIRNMNRRNDESFMLRDAILRDPKSFPEILGSILSDQKMDVTQAPDVHKTAGQTLLNLLIQAPESAPFVKQAATEALNGNLVEGAENRAQYTGVLNAVRTLEKAANAGNSDTKQREALRQVYGQRIVDAYNAGEVPRDEDKQGYVETFKDPLAGEGHLRTIAQAARQAPVGMIDTDAYRAGRGSIDANLKRSIFTAPTEEDNQVRAATYEIYDAIMGAMDPSQVQASGDGYTQAQAAADLALKQGSEFVAAMKGTPEADQKTREALEAQQEAALTAGNDDELIRLQGELDNLATSKGLRRRRQMIDSFVGQAKSYGIAIRDLRP